MTRGPDKQFDPEQALERAMELFWAQGYAATSMADLLEHMGIARKSLYSTFGSKRELFLRAIEHFAATQIAPVRQRLRRKGSALANIRGALRLIQSMSTDPDCRGCLVGNSIGQVKANDDQLLKILRGHTASLEQAYDDAFRRAQQDGELVSTANPRDLARMMLGLHQGLLLMGRVYNDPGVQRGAVRAALGVLDALAA